MILAVGCHFAHRSTKGLLLNLSLSEEQKLIHLDLDTTVIGKLFPPTLGVVGDARDGLAALANALGPGPACSEWEWSRLGVPREAKSPRYTAEVGRLIQILRDALPNRGRRGQRPDRDQLLDGVALPRAPAADVSLEKALEHPGPALLELPMAVDPPWDL